MISELIRFCRITLGGTDKKTYPEQQVSFMENSADAFVVFPYGMSANALNDSLGLLFSVNGDEQSLAALVTSAVDRIKELEQGEVIFYHPKTKSFTHYRNSGDIDVSINGSENIVITKDYNLIVAGDVNISAGGDANVAVTGDMNVGVGGNLEATVIGNADLTAAAVNVTTPVATFSGQVVCASLAVGAGGATVAGTLVATGDVTAGGISVISHVHAAGGYNIGGTPVTGNSGAAS